MTTWAERAGPVLDRLHEADVAAYRVVAQSGPSRWDEPLRMLSVAADHSKVSLSVAGALYAVGGPRGRRAAVTGVLAVAAASATTNVAVKLLARRRRPDRAGHGVDEERWVPMPTSSSFPSGHAAAAFAFATSVGREWPVLGVPLLVLAGAVGYSRVHTGVHYPGDVLVGAGLGLAVGSAVSRLRRAGQVVGTP